LKELKTKKRLKVIPDFVLFVFCYVEWDSQFSTSL
jgi:hypothetical protein